MKKLLLSTMITFAFIHAKAQEEIPTQTLQSLDSTVNALKCEMKTLKTALGQKANKVALSYLESKMNSSILVLSTTVGDNDTQLKKQLKTVQEVAGAALTTGGGAKSRLDELDSSTHRLNKSYTTLNESLKELWKRTGVNVYLFYSVTSFIFILALSALIIAKGKRKVRKNSNDDDHDDTSRPFAPSAGSSRKQSPLAS